MTLKKLNSTNIVIQSVFDNWSERPDLKVAWGFSAIITIDDKKLLFDTGSEGLKLLHNLNLLGFKPSDFEYVILSHEHWDHIGGVEVLLNHYPGLNIVLPQAFSNATKSAFKRLGANIIETIRPYQITSGIYTSGVMKGLLPEQSLVLLTNAGAVVLTGCAHPGVDNIIIQVNKTFGPILLVAGGFHLSGQSDQKIKEIIETFNALGVKYVAPCHCTGDRAKELFKEAYKDRYINMLAGTTIQLNQLK